MIELLYAIFSIFSLPLCYLIVYYRLWSGRYDRKRYKERFGISSQILNKEYKTIWFYAPNIGEAKSIIFLLEIYSKQKEKFNIVITSKNEEALSFLRKRVPIGCYVQSIPYKNFFWIHRFIKYWNPQYFIAVEGNIDSHVLYTLTFSKLEIIFINPNKTKKQFNKIFHSFIKLFYRIVLKNIDYIYQQTDLKNVELSNLKYTVVSRSVNLKYTNVLLFEDSKYRVENRKLYIALSTHESELIVIINFHKHLKIKYRNFLSIIILRKPEISDRLISELRHQYPDIVFQNRQSSPTIDPQTDIYIVDTFGEVELFCSLSYVTLLGGTLVNIGGHNPLEPLMLDNAVVIGPHHHKIKPLIEDLPDSLVVGNSNKEVLYHIYKFLSNPELVCEKVAKSKEILEQKRQEAEAFCHYFVRKHGESIEPEALNDLEKKAS